MIKYEQLPPSAQKDYNNTNKLRVIIMFVGYAITLFFVIRGMIRGNGIDLGSIIFGGIIPGFIHLEFVFKKIARTLGIIGIFVFLAFVLPLSLLTGWAFLIADLILYILKKPCIYPFENECFITYSKKAQEEAEVINFNATVNAFAQAVNETNAGNNVKDKLENLKEMLDNGLITENEYKAKKAELLERL